MILQFVHTIYICNKRYKGFDEKLKEKSVDKKNFACTVLSMVANINTLFEQQ